MSRTESVTQWITMLKDGQKDGAQNLWSRYVERLIRIASHKLASSPRKVADEEDVVICAFEAFLRGVESGRFSRLDDRNDLWQVLVMLTERKAIDQIRGQAAAKRGSGRVYGDSGFEAAGLSAGDGLDRFADLAPPPDFAMQAAETMAEMIQRLGDEELQAIAVAKLDGYTNNEIAGKLGRSLSSVERKLRLIREIWGEASTS